jgi:hypothetical protein
MRIPARISNSRVPMLTGDQREHPFHFGVSLRSEREVVLIPAALVHSDRYHPAESSKSNGEFFQHAYALVWSYRLLPTASNSTVPPRGAASKATSSSIHVHWRGGTIHFQLCSSLLFRREQHFRPQRLQVCLLTGVVILSTSDCIQVYFSAESDTSDHSTFKHAGRLTW